MSKPTSTLLRLRATALRRRWKTQLEDLPALLAGPMLVDLPDCAEFFRAYVAEPAVLTEQRQRTSVRIDAEVRPHATERLLAAVLAAPGRSG